MNQSSIDYSKNILNYFVNKFQEVLTKLDKNLELLPKDVSTLDFTKHMFDIEKEVCNSNTDININIPVNSSQCLFEVTSTSSSVEDSNNNSDMEECESNTDIFETYFVSDSEEENSEETENIFLSYDKVYDEDMSEEEVNKFYSKFFTIEKVLDTNKESNISNKNNNNEDKLNIFRESVFEYNNLSYEIINYIKDNFWFKVV